MQVQRNGVLASKYGIVFPKPIVQQQSAKQGCCFPEVSHLVRQARHSPIKQLWFSGFCVWHRLLTRELREGSKGYMEAGVIRERCVEGRDWLRTRMSGVCAREARLAQPPLSPINMHRGPAVTLGPSHVSNHTLLSSTSDCGLIPQTHPLQFPSAPPSKGLKREIPASLDISHPGQMPEDGPPSWRVRPGKTHTPAPAPV